MTWDQDLIFTILKGEVNNMKKIQIQKYPLKGRKFAVCSVSRNTNSILSVGLQGDFFGILLGGSERRLKISVKTYVKQWKYMKAYWETLSWTLEITKYNNK